MTVKPLLSPRRTKRQCRQLLNTLPMEYESDKFHPLDSCFVYVLPSLWTPLDGGSLMDGSVYVREVTGMFMHQRLGELDINERTAWG